MQGRGRDRAAHDGPAREVTVTKVALWASEDSETLNTAFVERLNLTIRQGSAYVRRRCRPVC